MTYDSKEIAMEKMLNIIKDPLGASRREKERLEGKISPRIQIILDTPYIFKGKHAAFMKEFTYKQETKYGVNSHEDMLLKAKFDQLPKGSYWEEVGINENGSIKYVERNDEMETCG